MAAYYMAVGSLRLKVDFKVTWEALYSRAFSRNLRRQFEGRCSERKGKAVRCASARRQRTFSSY